MVTALFTAASSGTDEVTWPMAFAIVGIALAVALMIKWLR